MTVHELYERYASAVAYIAFETPDGNESIGSAFHVGSGVFVTARHVVEGNTILTIGTTVSRDVPDPDGLGRVHGKPGRFTHIPAGKGTLRSGPYLHPDPSIDIAAEQVEVEFPRLKNLWLDAGYRGEDKGRGWVQKALGWTAELVERRRKPASEEVLKLWAEEWSKEGVAVDWEELLPPKVIQVLPKRWVVERTFSWLSQNRRMSKDYERLPETSEAFIYVAITRLMARRLARS